MMLSMFFNMCFSNTSMQVPCIEERLSTYASTLGAEQQLGVVLLV